MNCRRIFAGIFSFLTIAASQSFGQIITNVVPPLGSTGDAVVIWGNGFAPGGLPPATIAVRFNGTIATTNPNAVTANNQIHVNVPAGATTGHITVQINGGGQVSSPNVFHIIGAGPYVTNFTPVIGGSAGGTLVTMSGVHFSSVTNVRFDNRLGTGFFKNQDQIQITSPPGVTTGPLIALSSLGTAFRFSTLTNVFSAATNFFVPPQITSFAPTNGRPGTNVLILGTNFTASTAVSFGGTAAPFQVLSNRAILAVVPTNAITGVISVTAPASGPTMTTTRFRLLPTIFGFNYLPGGTPRVVINGANLNERSPSPIVTFFGGANGTVSSATFNTITSTVPAAAMSGPITVTTTNGSFTTSEILYLPPTITSFTPTNSPPGTRVRVNGANFTNATSITFGGVPVDPSEFTVTNNAVLGVTVPAGVLTGPIGITTPGGTTNSAGLFYGLPVITGFAPMTGLPGTNVLISGTNFLGATSVLFNGTPSVSVTVSNNNLIRATVPNGTTTGPITVVAPGGSAQSGSDFVITFFSDIRVQITDAPDPVFIGSNLLYTVRVFNDGPHNSSTVTFTNWLPPSTSLIAASTTHGSLNTNGNPILGNLGAISSGNFAQILLTVTRSVAGVATNRAAAAGENLDTAPGNNDASAVTVVWPLPRLEIHSLADSRIQLSWPGVLSNFTVQFATNMTVPSNFWFNIAAPPAISNNESILIRTNTGTNQFFRLRN